MGEANANREALSALMDGESTEIDLARVLKSVDDTALRDDWVRLHRIRDALQGKPPHFDHIDISAGVTAAINPKPHKSPNPLVGLAVAASVTLSVVFGGQQLLVSQTPVKATDKLPNAVVSLQGASALQASYGGQRNEPNTSGAAVSAPNRVTVVSQSPTASARYEHLAREHYQRLGIKHAKASASLQPSVLVPYARVPEPSH